MMENHQDHEGDKDDDEDEDDDNKQNYSGSEQFQDTLLPQQEELLKLKLQVMKDEDSMMSALAANKLLLQNNQIIQGALKMYELQKTKVNMNIKIVFVQHQVDFNTLQSFAEQCEDYVSN